MKLFNGISAAPGIGIGKIFTVSSIKNAQIPKILIQEAERNSGWLRFESSLQLTKEYFSSLLNTSNKEQQSVVQTYLLMLEDTEFIGQIKHEYETNSFNIEFIIDKKVHESADQLKAIGDAYLAERAADILDVYGRVVHTMLGYKSADLGSIPEGSIVAAHSLQPSQAMMLFQKGIDGLLLCEGGVSSHMAILARTYGVPAVFGIDKIEASLPHEAEVIIDANKALVILDPDLETKKQYTQHKTETEQRLSKLAAFITKKAVTKDGTVIQIFANIGSVEEAEIAEKEGADGIGLFRTEFLFMSAAEQGLLIDEETQYKAYSSVLEIMKGKPVTIRTLDAGGDKVIPLAGMPGRSEKNPLLGNRAIRFCLTRPDIFKTQLRALYRSSVHGKLKIMLPLLTDIEQIKKTKKLIHEVQAELEAENKPFNKTTPLGIMIETPAAAITADLFAAQCDFFSIGTNDLTQYTISVDRDNIETAPLFSEMHPAVLRMIRYTIASAHQAGIPVSVCGEMASRTESLEVLIGLGVRNISMSPKKISEIKAFLSQKVLSEMKEIADTIQ
ncbi:MAG TPA: phosphoenolpyruvate--protein phosphotransferase [Treponemataceae bacterium]|nr:phosphoenolpyruvate--protein phosphotransferase [Treponemataceae bacterium]